MNFTFVTLFPNLIEFYFQDSILKKAIDGGYLSYDFYNPRDFSSDKHRRVDDTLCGGGAGQLMFPQPLFDTLATIKEKYPDAYVIFPLAAAKKFNQNDAIRLATKKNIVLVSGRYEGIDERVIEVYADEVFSVGEYILTGGELPSLIIADAVSRNIEGVLGNSDSLNDESYNCLCVDTQTTLEAPSFAKPIEYKGFRVPSEFLKGNHDKIRSLKNKMSMCKTKYYRP